MAVKRRTMASALLLALLPGCWFGGGPKFEKRFEAHVEHYVTMEPYLVTRCEILLPLEETWDAFLEHEASPWAFLAEVEDVGQGSELRVGPNSAVAMTAGWPRKLYVTTIEANRRLEVGRKPKRTGGNGIDYELGRTKTVLFRKLSRRRTQIEVWDLGHSSSERTRADLRAQIDRNAEAFHRFAAAVEGR